MLTRQVSYALKSRCAVHWPSLPHVWYRTTQSVSGYDEPDIPVRVLLAAGGIADNGQIHADPRYGSLQGQFVSELLTFCDESRAGMDHSLESLHMMRLHKPTEPGIGQQASPVLGQHSTLLVRHIRYATSGLRSVNRDRNLSMSSAQWMVILAYNSRCAKCTDSSRVSQRPSMHWL